MAKIQTNDRTFLSTQFRRLSHKQCQKIHWASLEVMERTGVRLHEEEAIELAYSGGPAPIFLTGTVPVSLPGWSKRRSPRSPSGLCFATATGTGSCPWKAIGAFSAPVLIA